MSQTRINTSTYSGVSNENSVSTSEEYAFVERSICTTGIKPCGAENRSGELCTAETLITNAVMTQSAIRPVITGMVVRVPVFMVSRSTDRNKRNWFLIPSVFARNRSQPAMYRIRATSVTNNGGI